MRTIFFFFVLAIRQMDGRPPSIDSLSVFNDLLLDFVKNLEQTYQHVSDLQGTHSTLKGMIQADNTWAHEEFKKNVSPHAQLIWDKDETMFTDTYKQIAFLKNVNFEENWNQSPQETKDAIWQYMQNLLMISNSVSTVPPAMMDNIVQFVSSYEPQQGAEGLDIEHLLLSLQQDKNLSQLFSK